MLRYLVLGIALAGCTDGAPDRVLDGGGGEDVPLPMAGDPQRPPQGHAALEPWLAAGHYVDWACEAKAHPARPPGAHGSNRICSNEALSGSLRGTYPIGAAAVKELYRSGSITGFAVGVKVTDGADAPSWYWYEAVGGSVIADGVGHALCARCHADAPRDHVFTHVR